jgi:hypothetical protein
VKRNSGLTAILFLMLACAGVTAQDARGPLILPVADGGFVIFKSRMSWTDARIPTSQEPPAALRSYAFVGQGHIIHRVLEDSLGRPVFGYDLLISSTPVPKQFRIVIRPLDSQFGIKFRKREPDSQRPIQIEKIATVPEASEQKTLTDGDAFSLDLLVNQSTGAKIVDVVKVSFDRSNLEEIDPRTPRDFTLDALELSVRNYQLLINGEVAAASKSTGITSGALLWFYVQNRGRFIFSLVPRDGYDFQKIGVVEDNRIEFTFNGERYEWLSTVPFVGGRGRWNLWVLADPKYSPLFSANPMVEQKSIWEKFDGMINVDRNKNVGLSTLPANNTPNKKQKEAPAPRPRVMIGGADRIENLWPRNP